MAEYMQPQLLTGSISSTIGIGGGTALSPTISSDPAVEPGGRFTGGVRFNDPDLQRAFANPLTAEDYAQFQIDIGPGTQQTNDWSGSSKPMAMSTYAPQLVGVQTQAALDALRNVYDWSADAVNKTSALEYNESGAYIPPPTAPSLSIYHAGKPVTNDNVLSNLRLARAYRALVNPDGSNVFDLQSHPLYGDIRAKWYNSPYGVEKPKYGIVPKFNALMGIENQYGGRGPGYIPMDFYAKTISDKVKASNDAAFGDIQLAVSILDNWMQQPAFHGQYTSVDQFPAIWSFHPNSSAAARERGYIIEELQEEENDGGLFGGGFLGDLLSFAAPILSFIPGLQPLGWALGMMNAAASGNPLAMLASIAGPVLSSVSSGVSGFSGVGDLGTGLVAPANVWEFNFSPDALGSGFSASGVEGAVSSGLGLKPPLDWGPSGLSSVPSLSLPDTPPGFVPGDLGTGLGVPSNAFSWGLGASGAPSNLLNNVAKGVLKMAARGMEGPQQLDMLQRRNVQSANEQNDQPVFAPPMPVTPVSVHPSMAMDERWRRLRNPAQAVIPGWIY